MPQFTTSIAKFITTPHRVLTRGGATWRYNPPSTDNAAYLAEISPAMQTRLRRQGIVLPLAGGALLFGLECVGTVYGAGDWHGVIRAGELAFNGGFALVFALFLYAIRSIRRLPFHREVRYRYEHGKWRWER